jgi:two-component system, LytTR family, response regulator
MIRTLIVDDERLARAELRRLLAAHPQIESVGEAEHAEQARQRFDELRPALLFLDIQMPGLSGPTLAAELDGQAQIVFCTAYDRYAIDAFGLDAVDYLLKPVAPERLARTLQRLQPTSAAGLSPLPYDHGLLLKFGERARVVRLREIDRFESVGNHAAVHTAHGRAFILSSLARIEQRLDPAYFFRANRGDIRRLDAIQAIEPDVGSGFIATLADGSQVEVSRRQAQLLRERMGGFG